MPNYPKGTRGNIARKCAKKRRFQGNQFTDASGKSLGPSTSGGESANAKKIKSGCTEENEKDKMKDPKNFIKLQKEKLDVNALVALVTSPSCGAITNFIGTTRDNFENKKVVKLEYEAYEPMALKELNNICTEIRSKWSVENIAIYHRLGEVPVSEASVIIAISSPHRKESLEAVQFAIDSLKSSVPIWKKEVYDTEEFEWKENKECTWAKTKDEENEKNESPNITIDQNLVQIKADNDELNRRIESFITRKRQQVNVVNVQEFCCRRDPSEEGEGSCARVDAILIRNKDSKSHVKVHRVMNLWGPQTIDASKLHQKNLPADCSSDNMENYSSVLDERIWASEKVLGITKPVPRDIYERLKNIEDRILELESISPEYKEFWVAKTDDDSNIYYKPMRKRTFSAAELDSKLHELENKYVKKMK